MKDFFGKYRDLVGISMLLVVPLVALFYSGRDREKLRPLANGLSTLAVPIEVVGDAAFSTLANLWHGYVDLVGASAQLEAVVRALPFLAPMVLLDIGVPVIPKVDRVLAFCDEVILITEPFPASLRSTKRYMQELGNVGFGKSKLLSIVMINRIRADIQLTITQVQESLGQTVVQVIPPVPEIAYQAALQYLPIVKLQPDGLIAQQFKRLAEIIAQRRK